MSAAQSAEFAVFSFLTFPPSHLLPATRYQSFAVHSGVKLKFQPLPLRTALRAAVCASALGVLLEVAQLLLPGRHADPMDLLWMTLGAFAGAFGSASIFKLFAPSLPATSNP